MSMHDVADVVYAHEKRQDVIRVPKIHNIILLSSKCKEISLQIKKL